MLDPMTGVIMSVHDSSVNMYCWGGLAMYTRTVYELSEKLFVQAINCFISHPLSVPINTLYNVVTDGRKV